MGCDGVPGSNKKIDKCGRCGDVAAEAICLHVPCNIEKAPEQENGIFVKNIMTKFNGHLILIYRISCQTSCWFQSCSASTEIFNL